MKKFNFTLYTIVVLIIGSFLGGTLAYSTGGQAHVAWGLSKAGMMFFYENGLFVRIEKPKKIIRVEQRGDNKVLIHIE